MIATVKSLTTMFYPSFLVAFFLVVVFFFAGVAGFATTSASAALIYPSLIRAEMTALSSRSISLPFEPVKPIPANDVKQRYFAIIRKLSSSGRPVCQVR